MAYENGEDMSCGCGCSPIYNPPIEKLNADTCFSIEEPMDDQHEAFSSASLLLTNCYLHT